MKKSPPTKDPDLIGIPAGYKQRRGKNRDFLKKGKPLLTGSSALEEAHLKLKKVAEERSQGLMLLEIEMRLKTMKSKGFRSR